MGTCEECGERDAAAPLRWCDECAISKNGACTECGSHAQCSPHHTMCVDCANKSRPVSGPF